MNDKGFRMIMLCAALFAPFTGIAAQRLTLDESIDMALKRSLSISMAREGVKGAEARKREAMTGFLPKMNTSYNYTRLNEDPGFFFQGMAPLIPAGTMMTGTKDNYNWVIEARQPVFAGGGILANYQANKIAEDVARAEETAKMQQVVQDVKIAYFQILRAGRIQETAEQSVEMLNAHLGIARNYYRVGLIPKNDLLQAEVELANGKQAHFRAKNAVTLAKSQFNTLLRRDLSDGADVVDILTYQPMKQSYEACLETAKQNRPELKMAELAVAQAGKLVKAAQSDYFPALSVSGNYTRFGDNPSVSGSAYKDMESWTVMAVASWNFWEWGKTKYRVDAVRAKEKQAADAARELQDRVCLEIKQAYLALEEDANQIGISQKVIEQAEENFRISEARYKERVARSTEVLDAQTLLTKAKSDYANALADYHISQAKLQRAMGIIK
jgi:outer membrane protein